jgi:DNA-binding MarR family transcriptional regulator
VVVDDDLVGALSMSTARLARGVSRAAGHELPYATLRLLAQLDELGPVTITELAHADRCSQPTMSNAVRALEAKGWVVREANPSDARSWLVALTQEGRVVLAAARRRHIRVLQERVAAAGVGEDELRTTVSVLERLTRTQQTR